MALSRDSPAAAAERLVDALAIYRVLDDDRDSAECIHALGGVAAAEGQDVDAARLWGAAEALRERSGAALTPEEKAVDQRFLPLVRDELGAEEFARARLKGRSLQLTELEAIVSGLGSVAHAE
jgi:hypothetical protein